MLSATVEAPQITEQMRLLDGFDAVAKSEFVPAMQSAIAISVVDIQDNAPVLTGVLKSVVGGQVRFAMGDEVRGVMTAEARADDGFPYGYALNASAKFRYAGRRRKTKGWMRNVVFRKRKEVFELFARATERIVNRLAVKSNGE